MKKTFVYSFILTCIFIFVPPFMVQFDEENNYDKNTHKIEDKLLNNNEKFLNYMIDSILVDKKGNIIEYRIDK